MSELIQDYLRTRGARYFRGHHDDEYFFFVDALVDGLHKRLDVHLQADDGGIRISIASDRYYPASARDDLVALAIQWKAGATGAQVLIHDSSDPSRVGVSVQARTGAAGVESLGAFVDRAVTGAIDLFAGMRRLTGPTQDGPVLRDAG